MSYAVIPRPPDSAGKLLSTRDYIRNISSSCERAKSRKGRKAVAWKRSDCVLVAFRLLLPCTSGKAKKGICNFTDANSTSLGNPQLDANIANADTRCPHWRRWHLSSCNLNQERGLDPGSIRETLVLSVGGVVRRFRYFDMKFPDFATKLEIGSD